MTSAIVIVLRGEVSNYKQLILNFLACTCACLVHEYKFRN